VPSTSILNNVRKKENKNFFVVSFLGENEILWKKVIEVPLEFEKKLVSRFMGVIFRNILKILLIYYYIPLKYVHP